MAPAARATAPMPEDPAMPHDAAVRGPLPAALNTLLSVLFFALGAAWLFLLSGCHSASAAGAAPPQQTRRAAPARSAAAPAATAAKPRASKAQMVAKIDLGKSLERWKAARLKSPAADIFRWSYHGYTISVEADKDYMDVHGVRVALAWPVREKNGAVFLSLTDYNNTLSPLFFPAGGKREARRVRRVLLDPGHGGKMPGTENKTLKLEEKALALDTARRVKRLLEKRGYIVTLTRDADQHLELAERGALAKKRGADVFVSIHYNSGPAATAGVETYSLTPQGQYSTNDRDRRGGGSELAARERGHRYNTWNTILAYHVQSNLARKLNAADRGSRRARFGVLKEPECPAILVECGYLSNAAEAKKISTSAYREQIAQGIVDGIAAYAAVVDAVLAPPQSRQRRVTGR